MLAKILVVDDEPSTVDVLTRFLTREGYDVRTATNGQEALEKVQQEPPDLILLDVVMPELDGFTVCRRLKEDDRTALIPVVMLSGLDDREHRTRGIESGADDFLTKPFEQSILRVRISTLLRTKRLTDKILRDRSSIPNPPYPKSTQPTILVVDHDPNISHLMELVLEQEGHTVITSLTGSGAIAHVRTGRIDLVVMEWTMPDISGDEICRTIRESYPERLIPVLVLTARMDRESIVEMLRAGANDYIVKPFDVKKVGERVQSLLQKYVTSQVRNKQGDTESVAVRFDFPEEVKVPCEQYLLYFVEFLRDIGINVTADLREDAGQVLFSVTPKDKNEALDNIWEALGIYLRLPAVRNTTVIVSPETSIEVLKLSGQLNSIQMQFNYALATLQQKDLTIQQQDTTIQYQQRLIEQQIISGQVLVQALQREAEKDEDTEALGTDIIKVKPWSMEAVPFEVDLPELLRRLKEKFARKRLL